MNNSDNLGLGCQIMFVALLLMILSLFIGYIIGTSVAISNFQKQAVELGHGKYNNEGGKSSLNKFEWINLSENN